MFTFQASMFGFAVAPFKSGVSRHAVNCDGSKSYTGANAGAAAEYWTWRRFQMALCAWSLIQVALIYLFLPETAHPNTRGIENGQRKRGPERSSYGSIHSVPIF